jgi:NADH-quinone oxidoreductase subunit H
VIDMALAPMPIGFLFILAISSLGVYGIVLAGWSSNNKYALLGGLRSSAQMVSYEIAMGMSTIPVLLLAGNVTLTSIVRQQSVMGWNFFLLTISFFIFLVAAFAETNRLPFDLPETEGELVAGFHTEYGSMKFATYFMAEYMNMATISGMMTVFYFGGWHLPWITDAQLLEWIGSRNLLAVIQFVVFITKISILLCVFVWVRWTVPRFRFDQLMRVAWYNLIPLSLANLVLTALILYFREGA